MPRFDSVDGALQFAIRREEESFALYEGLASRMETDTMREVFHSFALEEKRHKAKLESIRAGKTPPLSARQVSGLDMSDYLADVEPTPNMDYRDALILAMKREKLSFKLYNDLASGAENEDLCGLFLGLAREEARHKLRFEIEYDKYVLQEN